MDELTPIPYRPTPAPLRRHELAATFRIGDAERTAACDALAEHFAAGRLDPAELDDRLARAMAARSQSDLLVLFADLGPRRTVAAPVRQASQRDDGSPRSGTLVPLLASIMIIALLIAGGMLLILGAYNAALFVAAVVGGTATGIAGACAAVVAQTVIRRR